MAVDPYPGLRRALEVAANRDRIAALGYTPGNPYADRIIRGVTGATQAASPTQLASAGAQFAPTSWAPTSVAPTGSVPPPATPVSIRGGLTGAASAGGSAASSAAKQGILSQFGPKAVGQAFKAGGWKGVGLGTAASVAGGMVDESSLFDGPDGVVNDTAGKMLKWGGAGAALGSVVPGIGTGLGALGGAGVGAIHSALERNGVLGDNRPMTDQNDERMHEAWKKASQAGLPESVYTQLQQQYQAGMAFAESDAQRKVLADDVVAGLQNATQMFAVDPTSVMSPADLERQALQAQQMAARDAEIEWRNYLGSMPSGTRVHDASPEETAASGQMVMQAILGDAIAPYTTDMISRADQAAAALGGNVDGAYAEATAGLARRQAALLQEQAKNQPIINALQTQAARLNQAASNQYQSAMGAVTSGDWQGYQSAQQSGILAQFQRAVESGEWDAFQNAGSAGSGVDLSQFGL